MEYFLSAQKLLHTLHQTLEIIMVSEEFKDCWLPATDIFVDIRSKNKVQ
jgi:hypothetical protein